MSRSPVATVRWAFLLGGTFISDRRVRTPRMASMISSMAFSSSGKSRAASATGQSDSMRKSPSWGRACQISSVMKGMKGWSSLSIWVSTWHSTCWALTLLSSSSPWRRVLVSRSSRPR